MEKITPNVYTETKIRGCNPSIVLTKEGSVFIDTAQWITNLLKMREFALENGPIKYLINTEPHIDHIFGNHWFAGECPVIGHEKIFDSFWKVAGAECYDYSVDVIKRQDPQALKFMPSREDYIINKPQITFSERMSLVLGDHHFELYYTPGHSDSNISVYVPEEKVLFVGDTLFVDCQVWLHSADIDKLLESLRFLRKFDAEYIIPGHGPVVTKEYIDVQIAFIYEWITAVANGMAKGWTREECIKRINFSDRYPVDIGQSEMMEYIQTTNVVKLYDYLAD